MSKCEDILNELDPNMFSGEEKSRLFSQLKDAAKSPRGLEKLNDIVDKLLKDKEDSVSETKRRNLITQIKIADTVHAAMLHKEYDHGLMSVLTGIFSKVEGAGASIDALKKTYRSSWFNRLTSKLQMHPNDFAKLMDKMNEEDLANGLFDTNSIKDPEIKRVAEEINKTTEEQVHAQNNRGASIKVLKRFIAHQVHDARKLMKVGSGLADYMKERSKAKKIYGRDWRKIELHMQRKAFDQWKDFIKPNLDTHRTFNIDERGKDIAPEEFKEQQKQMDDILWHAYNVLLKGTPLDEDALRGFGDPDLAKRISEHRFFHFKDGKSWLDYNKEYGAGDLKTAIFRTINRNSDNIALLEKMGTKPDVWYETTKKQLIDKSDNLKIAQNMNKVDRYFHTVLDRDMIPVNYIGAKIGMAIRSSVSLTKLGLVVLTSINDLAQQIATMRINGVGLFDRWSNILTQFLGRLSDDGMRREVADATGALADLQMGHMRNKFSAVDSPTGFFGKALGAFFKWNLQQPWDVALREGTATALARNLANNRERMFSELDPDLQGVLRRYNINHKQWELIRSNREAMKNHSNKMFITPDMTHDLTDESMAKYLGKDPAKLTVRNRRDIQEEINTKLRMYFIDQTDMAQLEPRAAERAMLLQGTQPGTVHGEIMRFISQFKSYPLAVARRSLGGMMLRNSDDGFVQSLYNGSLSTKGLGEYFVASLMFGYLSHALHSAVEYQSLPNPADFGTYKDSILEGAGLFGDLMGGQYMQHGGLVSAALGPGAATIGDIAKLLYNVNPVNAIGQKKSYHTIAMRSMLNFADKDLMPSTIYTKTLQKKLKIALMNHIDPGAASRMQHQVDKYQQNNIPLF